MKYPVCQNFVLFVFSNHVSDIHVSKFVCCENACFIRKRKFSDFFFFKSRSAISHNKSIEVLCSTVFKNTFTVAVLCTKSPQVSSKCTENLRLLKHCMVCEERLFYPASDGFPVGQ